MKGFLTSWVELLGPVVLQPLPASLLLLGGGSSFLLARADRLGLRAGLNTTNNYFKTFLVQLFTVKFYPYSVSGLRKEDKNAKLKTDRQTYRQIDKRTKGQKDKGTKGQKDKRTKGQKDKKTKKQKNRPTASYLDRLLDCLRGVVEVVALTGRCT